jgi:hypothetical protein
VSEWSSWHGCTEAQCVLAGRDNYVVIPRNSMFFEGLGWIWIGSIIRHVETTGTQGVEEGLGKESTGWKLLRQAICLGYICVWKDMKGPCVYQKCCTLFDRLLPNLIRHGLGVLQGFSFQERLNVLFWCSFPKNDFVGWTVAWMHWPGKEDRHNKTIQAYHSHSASTLEACFKADWN